MKKNGNIFEFYESSYISVIGMIASVIFGVLGFVQPGPVKEPLYISVMVLPFSIALFLFFYNMSKKPFILVDKEKIVIQKKSFYFSEVSTIFFYRQHGKSYKSIPQEILDIRLKGELFCRKHYFVLSFMPNIEIRSLIEHLSKKVRTLHLPAQYCYDLPHLNIPPEMRNEFKVENCSKDYFN